MRTALVVTLTLTALAAGAVQASDPWEVIARESRQRLGVAVMRPGPAEAERAFAAELLAGGLTRAEAAQLALRRNPELLAAAQGLAIAAADLEQAGLRRNPTLGALARSSRSGGDGEVEVGLSFDVWDAWALPRRGRQAQASLEGETMRVVSVALAAAAEASRAHDRCLAAREEVEQTRALVAAAEQWRDHVHERYHYGYSSELEMSAADAALAGWELELALVRTGERIALARLRQALDLADDVELAVVGELELPAEDLPGLGILTQRALASRPDIEVSRRAERAAEAAFALERGGAWRQVSLGPSYARDSGERGRLGLSLEVGLPVSDDNRARVQRAAAEVAEARSRTAVLEAQVRQQVASAWERVALAQERERLLRERVVPARRRALEHAEHYAREMQLNLLVPLEARQELARAERERLRAVAALRMGLADLELAIGELLWEPPGQPHAGVGPPP